jgi:hypothetical protein
MKQFLLGLSISFAFILGCVTAAAVTSQADAQGQATAPSGGTECFAATTWYVTGKQLNAGEMPQTVRIPAGWQVVGAGASEGSSIVMLCRGL